MAVIITDQGFASDTWTGSFQSWGETGPALHMPSDTDPATFHSASLDAIEIIKISFPSFADGRGFTLARLLRLHGYRGRLRASGHVIADQFAMARRAGFDEIEIDDDLAKRQPEPDWIDRAAWRPHDYQARLRG